MKLTGLEKVIQNLRMFADFCEWQGKTPSITSHYVAERRWAYWLVHTKQSRQGKGNNIWYDEIGVEAEKLGFGGIFEKDTRVFKGFDLTGKRFGDLEVLRQESERNSLGQVLWRCRLGSMEKALSSFQISRIRDNPGYLSLSLISDRFCGLKIGCWELCGFYGVLPDGETQWMAKRGDTFGRIELPSFEKLIHFFRCSSIDRETVRRLRNLIPEWTYDSSSIMEDISGKRFGRWTVISPKIKNAKNGEWMWSAVCDCGTLSVVRGAKLKNSSSLSCGCLRGDGQRNKVEEKGDIVEKEENNTERADIERVACQAVS